MSNWQHSKQFSEHLSDPAATLTALRKERIRRDATRLEGSFIDFFEAAWPHIDPAPFVSGWHLVAIAQHLEAVARGQIRKLLINVPPRHSKTTLTSIAWPCWLWAQRPDPKYPLIGPQVKFLCLSYGDQLAMDNATLTRRLIASEWYQERWGRRVQIADDQDAKNKFDTAAGGSRISSSFGGGVLGRGGDIKIIDDPHKVAEAESEVTREAVIRAYDGTLRSRITDPRIAAEVVIMQRLHENDLTGHILDHEPDVVHLSLPAEYDASRHCTTSIGWSDPRSEDGELLWPARFGAVELMPFKAMPYEWSGQWQQVPIPRGGGIIKSAWWQIWDKYEAGRYGLEWHDEKGKLKEMPPFDFVIASLDSAYSAKKSADYSALTLWGSFTDLSGNRRWMLMYAWQQRLEFHDLVEKVAKDCRRYNVQRLLIEGKASGMSVEQEIRRAYAREDFGVQVINPTLDKIARAHSIVYLFIDKMVWTLDPSVIDWAGMAINECANFPKGTHDDMVDSVTQALGWLRLAGLAERRDEHSAEVESLMKLRPRRAEPLYPGMQ
jgi:predicted phage terminase large subunit-like protein